MTNTFFTSDTHYGHKNILHYCPWSRGFIQSVGEMDNILIRNHNKMVGKDDTVYHLGDFAFGSQAYIRDILAQLNGKIHLIRGNHDRAFSVPFQNSLLFEELVETFMGTYCEIKVEGQSFVLNHYAQRVWNRSHYGIIHLFGHSHGSLPGVGKSVDVGVDSVEMAKFTGGSLRPWSFEEVINFMNQKAVYMPDHHDENTK